MNLIPNTENGFWYAAPWTNVRSGWI